MARKINFKAVPDWTGTLNGTEEILLNPAINNTEYKILLSQLLSYISSNVTVDVTSLEVDTISENTSGNGVTVDGANIKDGGITANSQIAAFYPILIQNNITAGTGGQISVTNYLTTINTDAGGDAFALANGTQIGQVKKILLVVDGGGDATITPVSLNTGTTITMNDATDYIILMWNGTAWYPLENSGCTIA